MSGLVSIRHIFHICAFLVDAVCVVECSFKDDEHVAAGLGYVVHMLVLLSKYLEVSTAFLCTCTFRCICSLHVSCI